MENLVTNIPVGLAYIACKSSTEGKDKLCSPNLCYCVTSSRVITARDDVIVQLYGHLLEGLDVSKAMAQPKTAYKVRHLKMGVRLAGALLQCDDYIALGLMVGFYRTEMMQKIKNFMSLFFLFTCSA